MRGTFVGSTICEYAALCYQLAQPMRHSLRQIGMTEAMAKGLIVTEIAQAYDLQKLSVHMQRSIKVTYFIYLLDIYVYLTHRTTVRRQESQCHRSIFKCRL